MSLVQRIRARLGALLVGTAVTLLGCALFATGSLARLDDAGLDLHFRHFSSIDADPRIVLIDIDDSSLEAIGEWPWPRRLHADIVRTLHEAGAKQIVYDIVFAEPTPARLGQAQLGGSLRGVTDETHFIHDDRELSEAVAAAGNVYLATFGRLSPPDVDPHEFMERAMALVGGSPDISLSSFREVIGASGQALSDDFYWLVRVSDLLERGRFELNANYLAAQLVGSKRSAELNLAETIERVLPTAAKFVARRRALELSKNREVTLNEMEFARDRGELNSDWERSVLLAAAEWGKSVTSIHSRLPAASESSERTLAHASDLTPPFASLATAAKGAGLVTFEREGASGVVREVPLLVEFRDKLLPQLGFLAAMEELGIDWAGAIVDAGEVRLGADEGTLSIPIGGSGATLINWSTPPDRRWEHSFEHIPAARVLEVAYLRRGIENNSRHFERETAELVRRRHADTPAEYTTYMALIKRGLEARDALTRDHPNDGAALTAELQSIDDEVRAIEQEAAIWVEHAWRQWEPEEPQTEAERDERSAIHELYLRFSRQMLEHDLRRRNEELAESVATLLAELGSKVRGRICFVGYTASTVADFVSSPAYPSMPGVMAHANVANMLLQGKFVRRASLGVRLGLLALAGVLVALLACAGGWRVGVVGLLAVLGGLGLAGWLQFARDGVYLSTPVAVVVAAAAWAGTTALRQGTEERSRRNLEKALRQYTSPAIAARIADRVGGQALAPEAATVTCFFADLRNFTLLSERLGPARTKDLLNPYLEAVSEALVTRGAMVNKFTGDGVFAFFNAPLHPHADHARDACAAALQTVRAVDLLDSAPGIHPGSLAPREKRIPNGKLVVRVGLASGEAFVGDYGSSAKLDYTCIGDTVNVAARLEDANKFFGTRVLVNAATREASGQGLAFRYLGRVLLLGKEAAVETYELVGQTGEVNDSTVEFIGEFERAVRMYQSREWQECARAITRCLVMQPHDAVSRLYASRLNAPCEADSRWTGAIAGYGMPDVPSAT
jgi:class 3 adenylate cyclase/CHASE2 domain-containing sensor protein